MTDSQPASLGNWARDYGKQFAAQAFERVHMVQLGGLTPLEWLLAYLEGIGEDNLVFAVSEDITLWELMAADENLRQAMTTNNWLTGMAASFSPDEMAEVVYSAVVKRDPTCGKITSKSWFEKSFAAYLEAKWQATASGTK